MLRKAGIDIQPRREGRDSHRMKDIIVTTDEEEIA